MHRFRPISIFVVILLSSASAMSRFLLFLLNDINKSIECVVKESNTNCVWPILYSRERFRQTNVDYNINLIQGSRPINEVKHREAGAVLGWVTAWEPPVL